MTVRVYAGHQPIIPASAYVDPLALVLGQVTLGAHASVWPMAVARGDVQRIEIGARTNIQDNAVLHVTHDSHYCPGGTPLIIGEAVTVGHQATLHACTVGHHCMIGIGATVLDEAELEPYVLLAAGSLVPPGKKLQGGQLWRGSPAKPARALTEQEIEYFEYAANNYVKLSGAHKQSLQAQTT